MADTFNRLRVYMRVYEKYDLANHKSDVILSAGKVTWPPHTTLGGLIVRDRSTRVVRSPWTLAETAEDSVIRSWRWRNGK